MPNFESWPLALASHMSAPPACENSTSPSGMRRMVSSTRPLSLNSTLRSTTTQTPRNLARSVVPLLPAARPVMPKVLTRGVSVMMGAPRSDLIWKMWVKRVEPWKALSSLNFQR
jgi:hypothetical protein